MTCPPGPARDARPAVRLVAVLVLVGLWMMHGALHTAAITVSVR